MRDFSQEGIKGCLILAIREAEREVSLDRNQIEAILDYFSGELDTTSNRNAEAALEDFCEL